MRNPLLYPFSWLYGLLTGVRNLLYSKGIFRSSEFDIPVINVGNLSAGGNGKTPMTEYLAALLHQHYRVAVLSRGYGRKTRGFREIALGDKATDSGDEPMQIKEKFGDKVAVFVGERRVPAILNILSGNPDIEVIILDDAFQHRAIRAGLNLLLTDYHHLFTRDVMLPAGRLREWKSGARRADAIVVTKCPPDLTAGEKENIRNELKSFGRKIFFSGLKYGPLIPVLNATNTPQPSDFLLVTAIAKPQLLKEYAGKQFKVAGEKIFPDHHRFTAADMVAIEKKLRSFAAPPAAVLTTTKDAVKFKDYFANNERFNFPVYALPVEVVIDKEMRTDFENLIKDYVRESSGDRKIYSE